MTVLGQGTLEKDGFSFNGWMQDDIYYYEDDTFEITNDMTLYAVWIPVYNVTYHANGGTGDVPVDDMNYESGATVNVLGQGDLTMEGYTLYGWMNNFNFYREGDTFEITKDMTLKAVWTKYIPVPQVITYNVTYDANGGTGDVPVDDINYTAGTTVTVLGQGTLERDGYTFGGWQHNFNFYQPGDTFTITNGITLNALWILEVPITPDIYYNVTYDANGGTGDVPVDDINYESGTEVIILGKGDLERDGYTFGGWQYGFNFYQPGDTFYITNNITLNALWVLEVPVTPDIYYNVTYDANGGTGNVPVDNINYTAGTSMTVLGQGDLEKEGYTFHGWMYDIYFYYEGDMLDITNDMTLYAIWIEDEPVTYNVTYNANGGTGTVPVDNINYTDGTNATVASRGNLAMRGYTFLNWNTESDRTGVTYIAGSMITMDSDVTLYAQWRRNSDDDDDDTSTSGSDSTDPVDPDDDDETSDGNEIGSDSGSDSSNPYDNIVIIGEGDVPLGGLEDIVHIRYLSGYDDGSVKPDKAITRAEAASIFYRLLKETYTDGSAPKTFSDVSSDAWYSIAISKLAENGIIGGYPDGTFRPDQPITRAEFATITSKFDKLILTSGIAFSDVPEDHWAVQYINSAYVNGWVDGYSDYSFKPENPITRAEAVKIINTILNRKILLEDIPESAPEYIDLDKSHWAHCDIIEASTEHTYTRKDNDYEIWE